MSYNQQLRSVFADDELALLSKMVDEEHIASICGMTTKDKRCLQSIKDKLAGAQMIRNSKTTPPGKL